MHSVATKASCIGEKGKRGTSVLQHFVWTFSCLGMHELLADEILLESPSNLPWSRRLTDSHRRWHCASRKQAGRRTQYNMLLPERTLYRKKLEVARTLTGPCDPKRLVG